MRPSSFTPVRFGGLPESYWQARKEAPRRRAILADPEVNLDKPIERVYRDLVASITYRAKLETDLQRQLVNADIERCETLLAFKLDQIGPEAPQATRIRQQKFLKQLEDTLHAWSDALYKVPPILANALLEALNRLEGAESSKPQ